MSEQVVDAEVEGTAEELPSDPPQPDPQPQPTVEVHDLPQHTPPANQELVPRPTREALTPLDPEQVVAGMTAYQELLPKLLDASDYQDAGRGKRFVKKSGWRKIARAFNLSVELVSSRVFRDEHGEVQRAEVVARAIAPNGQVQDGDGYCSIDEDRFSGPKGNKSKLENDLRATATTRAKNRAISDLVGMGEVSAEEAENRTGAAADLPASRALVDAAKQACRDLAGPNAPALWGKVAPEGKLPGAVGIALVYAAAAHKAATNPTAETDASAADAEGAYA